MTILESSISVDLRAMVDYMKGMTPDDVGRVHLGNLDPVIDTLDIVISKIQHLRCEVTAQLDRL